MKQLILLCMLLRTASFVTDQEAWVGETDQLMQSADYPKPGDIPVLNRKVFKGRRVSIREHPYIASVRRMVSHYVTGALLTRNLVITVAHPLHEVPVQELSVVLGENYSDRGSKLFTVILVIIHEEFDPYTLKNDVSLLRFYEDVSYKGSVKSIALPPPLAPISGEKAFVTGWGRCDNMGTELCLDRTSKYYPEEKMDPMLRTVTFTMKFPNYYCEGYNRHEVPLSPGMLCAGVAREEHRLCPCLGAPGAALVTGARLAGLLSWGFGCGYSYDLPLVYTSTEYFASWITHNIEAINIISEENLTEIFLATKAVVLSQWLIETRIITPKLHLRMDKNIVPLSIDRELMKMRGSIYDVRDYIANGVFHQEKAEMYENLREEYEKFRNTTPRPPRVTLLLEPFIGNETLLEIGFNTSNIVSDAAGSTQSSEETSYLYDA